MDGVDAGNGRARSRVVRAALVVIGSISVGLGVLGIFLPLLPTTPFLLLAAACFVRSSTRLHRWLMTHPRLGPYVRGFVGGAGMPARAKRNTLLTLWIVIGISAALVGLRGGSLGMKLGICATLLVVAVLVTRYVRGIPTAEPIPVPDDER
jgi:uncharacterized membrane protein YbaN (DUF454 family)